MTKADHDGSEIICQSPVSGSPQTHSFVHINKVRLISEHTHRFALLCPTELGSKMPPATRRSNRLRQASREHSAAEDSQQQSSPVRTRRNSSARSQVLPRPSRSTGVRRASQEELEGENEDVVVLDEEADETQHSDSDLQDDSVSGASSSEEEDVDADDDEDVANVNVSHDDDDGDDDGEDVLEEDEQASMAVDADVQGIQELRDNASDDHNSEDDDVSAASELEDDLVYAEEEDCRDQGGDQKEHELGRPLVTITGSAAANSDDSASIHIEHQEMHDDQHDGDEHDNDDEDVVEEQEVEHEVEFEDEDLVSCTPPRTRSQLTSSSLKSASRNSSGRNTSTKKQKKRVRIALDEEGEEDQDHGDAWARPSHDGHPGEAGDDPEVDNNYHQDDQDDDHRQEADGEIASKAGVHNDDDDDDDDDLGQIVRRLEFTTKTAQTPGRYLRRHKSQVPLQVFLRIRPSLRKPPKASNPVDPIPSSSAAASAGDPEPSLPVEPEKSGESEPALPATGMEGSQEAIYTIRDGSRVEFRAPPGSQNHRRGELTTSYRFSQVFGPGTDQEQLFTQAALPLVDSLFAGQNGLVFAYGITNSGPCVGRLLASFSVPVISTRCLVRGP